MEETSGGYCSGVPPLPIPNREVKPACADGTAMQCGRVGSRRLFKCEPRVSNDLRLFFYLFSNDVWRSGIFNLSLQIEMY